MRGKRAPELAAGCLDEVFQQALGVGKSFLMKCLRAAPISPEEERLLWQDFEAARGYVQLGLQVKFDFFTKLPWQLAGLSHHNVEKAREVANIILEKTQGLDASDPTLVHHPLTLKFLSPIETLRPMIQSFAAGQPMPALLHTEASKLALMPVVERSIEAKHSLISRRVQKNWRSGRVVSLTLRVPDIKAELKADARFFDELIAAFALARDPRKAAQQLGIQNHPSLLDATFSRLHRNNIVGLVNKIVYRCDLESKFESHLSARQEHDAHVSKRARLSKKELQSLVQQDGNQHLQRRVLDHSFDSVLRVAIRDHFKVTSSHVGSGAMYTLSMVPSASGALPVFRSLETLLNASLKDFMSAPDPFLIILLHQEQATRS